MGFALAEVLAQNGACVILVTGPSSQQIQHENIRLIRVQTAAEMLSACLEHFPRSDGAILSAAVSDFRPVAPISHKIKRKGESITIELVPNPDIAANLGKMKKSGQVLAGFALETENGLLNASEKLVRKNFDFIVLNSLQDEGSGFNSDTNKITIITKDNKTIPFELKSKYDVAFDIVHFLKNLLHQ